MTLLELLATLVLVSIIGTLSYSILFQGYSNYQRIQAESELRDEADLIMSSLIKDLFSAKKSEISTVDSCNSNQNVDSLLTLTKSNSTPLKFQFIKDTSDNTKSIILKDGKPIISNRNVSFIPYSCVQGIPLSELHTYIKAKDNNSYNIKFKLRILKGKKEYDLEFENTVQVIQG